MIFIFTPENEALDAGFRFGQRLYRQGLNLIPPENCDHPYVRVFREGVDIAFEIEQEQDDRRRAVVRLR